MSTFSQSYYHIVFSTKNRENVLLTDEKEKLFKYIWGIVKNKKCYLYRINGIENHIHLLINLHPSICLSDLVKLIKSSTSKWIKEDGIFPDFAGWQDGYGAFTVSHNDRDKVIQYIINQEEHHKKINFEHEFKTILDKLGIIYNEKYVF